MAQTKIYPYAVLDENAELNEWISPYSVHTTRSAAIRQAERLNAASVHGNYRAVQWAAGPNDKWQPGVKMDA